MATELASQFLRLQRLRHLCNAEKYDAVDGHGESDKMEKNWRDIFGTSSLRSRIHQDAFASGLSSFFNDEVFIPI